jgi:hypothetical protein
MACDDCSKDQKKSVVIGLAGGAIIGATLCFVIIRYARR